MSRGHRLRSAARPGGDERMIERFLTWLLWPKCHLCGERVYAKDGVRHRLQEHAGDRL